MTVVTVLIKQPLGGAVSGFGRRTGNAKGGGGGWEKDFINIIYHIDCHST
jgi:hypothetical protein